MDARCHRRVAGSRRGCSAGEASPAKPRRGDAIGLVSREPAATPRPRSSTVRRSPAEPVIAGPAIVEDPDCTALVLPGDVARMSDKGHIIIAIKSESCQ